MAECIANKKRLSRNSERIEIPIKPNLNHAIGGEGSSGSHVCGGPVDVATVRLLIVLGAGIAACTNRRTKERGGENQLSE